MGKTAGLDQLDREIDDLVRKLDGEGTERAISVAAGVILKEVESRTPVRTGLLKASLRLGHYADRTLSSGKTRRYKATVSVPNSKRHGIMYYAVFLEYGTSKMAAHPFMRPAFEASEQKAITEFEQTLKAELEK